MTFRYLLLFALTATPLSALAEDRIHVVVAGKLEDKCFTELGYEIVAGADASRTDATNALTKRFPEAKQFFHADNEKKGKPLGRHLVIVSSDVPDRGCTKHFFGVGFGEDEAAATKAALRNLAKRSIWWERKRDGYKLELSEKR